MPSFFQLARLAALDAKEEEEEESEDWHTTMHFGALLPVPQLQVQEIDSCEATVARVDVPTIEVEKIVEVPRINKWADCQDQKAIDVEQTDTIDYEITNKLQAQNLMLDQQMNSHMVLQ